jgi:hypothetical protein
MYQARRFDRLKRRRGKRSPAVIASDLQICFLTEQDVFDGPANSDNYIDALVVRIEKQKESLINPYQAKASRT